MASIMARPFVAVADVGSPTWPCGRVAARCCAGVENRETALRLSAGSAETETTGTQWKYGIQASAGYFNFRNSLFVDVGPNPPGNLGEDWFEYAIKPWVSFERETSKGTWFGSARFIRFHYNGRY